MNAEEIQDNNFVYLMKNYPIMIPELQGVEQFMVLSNRWVVVVTKNTKEIHDELMRLSGGAYSKDPVGTIRKYWIQARENAKERQLDNAAYFSLEGEEDSNYKQSSHPKNVFRWVVPLEDEKYPGFVAEFAHYSYLELPRPLVNGKTYTLTLKNGNNVSFTYDEMHTVSPAIELNQLGYLPDVDPKFAYLSLYVPGIGTPADALPESMTFAVIDALSGNPALNGTVKVREKEPVFHTKERQPMTGTNVYEMNLGPLKQEGFYFITIPGVGRSWPFRIGEGAYGDGFYTSARGLYHQRAAVALEEPFTAWTRDKCEWGKIYNSPHIPFIHNVKPPKNYRPFDVLGYKWKQIKGKLATEPGYTTVEGGWHDAGDYDRRLEHYTVVFDLLNLYEMKPNHFFDGQLNLPESGNGIPDILDEVEFGLRIWKHSQLANGGVAGAVETDGHPKWCAGDVRWFFSKRTRWASFLYAAAAAQFAKAVEAFDSELSQTYKNSAIRAYEFGINPKNSVKGQGTWAYTIPAATNRGKGQYYEYKWGELWDYNVPYFIAARLQLYRLTGDEKYVQPFNKDPRTGLEAMLIAEISSPVNRGPFKRPTFREQDFSAWVYFGVVTPELAGVLSEEVIGKYKNLYANKANEMVALSNNMPYRRSKDRSTYGKMGWGFGIVTHQARALLIGHYLFGNETYRDVATYNLDYMLGANPMGMSWTTGLGWAYPIPIQHGISRDVLQLDEPLPGITIYGPTASNEWGGSDWKDFQGLWGWKDASGNVIWFVNKDGKYHPKPIPLLRRWIAHPRKVVAQNEFTIHETMSPNIFVFGYLMSEGWAPDPSLLDRQPRTKSELFGYWYLP